MSGNPLRKTDAAALYAQLGRLIENMPALNQTSPLGPEQMLWLGRAEALVAEALGASGQIDFTFVMGNFDNRAHSIGQIQKILYRALAQMELELPAPPTNSFIPAGNSFDALKGIQRIFSFASTSLMVVDPYLDEKFITDFAAFTPANVEMRLLTVRADQRAALTAALKHWRKQYGAERPIVLRSAPRASLHDRAIIVDDQRVWTVGQSFNALAARAPTSFVELDTETAGLKIQAYLEIWADAGGR